MKGFLKETLSRLDSSTLGVEGANAQPQSIRGLTQTLRIGQHRCINDTADARATVVVNVGADDAGSATKSAVKSTERRATERTTDLGNHIYVRYTLHNKLNISTIKNDSELGFARRKW